MRVRAERCTSLFRSARTLTPTPLPEGEGLCVAALTNVAAPLNLQTGTFSLREKVAAAG